MKTMIIFPKAFWSKPALVTYPNLPLPFILDCLIPIKPFSEAIFVFYKKLLKFKG